jgi:thioredoxin-like negative regulator of GroEL
MELRHAVAVYILLFAPIVAIDATREQSEPPSAVSATISSVVKHPRRDAARDRDTGYATHSRNLVQSLQSINKQLSSSKAGKFTTAQQKSIDGEIDKAIDHALTMLSMDSRDSDDQVAATRELVREVMHSLIRVSRQVH